MATTKKPITASGLRQDIYRILDEVLLTGEAIEISRGGELLRLEPPKGRKRNLAKVRVVATLAEGDLEDLVHVDWSSEWRP